MTSGFALPTARLILRDWRDEDLAPFAAMCGDPRVMEYLGGSSTEADCVAGIVRQRTGQSERGYSFWAIERREDGAFLGFCGLKPGMVDTPIAGKTEIGWRLHVDAWGQGYAREAAQASLDWAWAHLPDEAIWAITAAGNLRSWGLMERLGMTRHAALDFDMPILPAASPHLRHITYSIGRAA
ncbi:MAG: GNAT family N-acetyltransferase [Sphingobium sp.]|nr:GNAT family N-acetyltransferase [Sphingobium sp.]